MAIIWEAAGIHRIVFDLERNRAGGVAHAKTVNTVCDAGAARICDGRLQTEWLRFWSQRATLRIVSPTVAT